MALSKYNTEYVCTLSNKLIKLAEDELNEKPEWRSRDIQALRDMIKAKPELKICTDDAFLLRFLRAKKFDYDRAYNLIVRHYEMKVDDRNRQLFHNLRPSAVKHVLEAGVTGVLPHRDKLGRRILMFRPGAVFRLLHWNVNTARHNAGKWNPSKYAIDDVFRTNFLSLSKLVEEDETQVTGVILLIDIDGITLAHAKNVSPFFAKKVAGLLEEEEAQVCGIVLFADLKNMGWKQTMKLKPFYAKRVMGLLQDCFPMRFKGIHYVNEPVIFDYVFAIIRPFIKDKILSRIHFHGTKFEELKEFIDEEHIPADYGGKGPPFSNEEWTKTLIDWEVQYDEESKYGFDKSTGKMHASSDTAGDCLSASYRKLEV